MRILQLCIRVPCPPNDGATIAMYNICRSLYESGAQVKILSFNTNKNYVAAEKIPKEFIDKTGLETVDLDLSIKPVHALLNLFKKDSYNISRFVSEEFNKKLERILSENSYDIIQLEGLYVTPYIETIKKNSKARIVLRSHNVEFVIWERMALSATNLLKKKYLQFLARRLKNYELNLINSYDAILPITEVDQKTMKLLGCTIPMLVTPIGVDADNYPFDEKQEVEFSIFHLGSMDWMPNLDAVDWFLNTVYEKLVKQISDIKIYLAGKDMPERIKQKANKNLIVVDKIEQSKKFMYDKPVMIVPLLSGGGMRVKIIEGMAEGRAIVSTTIGAEGINYTDQKNILIADTPDEFCSAIYQLKTQKDLCRMIGKAARELVEIEYDNNVIGKKLILFYKSLLLTRK